MKAVKVDSACRVRLPELKPGEYYDVQSPDSDQVLLRKLNPQPKAPTTFEFRNLLVGLYRLTICTPAWTQIFELNERQLEELLKTGETVGRGKAEHLKFELKDSK